MAIQTKIILALLIIIPLANCSVQSLVTSLLKFEEGTHANGICYPYRDSRGYPTIGYGRLCAMVQVANDAAAKPYWDALGPCSQANAESWLQSAISQRTNCVNSIPNIRAAYSAASDYRKAVIISMAYQLGCDGLSGFKKTLGLMANGNWDQASREMLNSAWANQTPNRANRHSIVIRTNGCGNFCGYYGW